MSDRFTGAKTGRLPYLSAAPPLIPFGVILVLVLCSFGSATSARAEVELEIRSTVITSDDYLTWAPTPARIRLRPAERTSDLTVVLTNDPQNPIPPGRDQPLDGDLAFDLSVLPGRTAEKDQLALVLPKNGSWVEFIVAGKFPRASSADKDAVIEVHEERPDGVVLLRHPVMVRIRKDHRKLTEQERDRFLQALRYLRWTAKTSADKGLYREFVRLHRVATGIHPVQEHVMADMGHQAPAFIAWHRAFLLQFERALQQKFPDVALPYWVMTEDSNLFTSEFLGENVVLPPGPDGNPVTVDAIFEATNPLFGWTIDMAPLPRFAKIRSGSSLNDFDTDAKLFTRTTYSNYPDRANQTTGFVDGLESNPHNTGHLWVGLWMRDCQDSPRDPIFWVFHTGFDRQWAEWQYLRNKIDPTGANGSYHPLGRFDTQGASVEACDDLAPNDCTPIGHNAEDTMWPWNDLWGKQETVKGSWPSRSIFEPFFQNFPASTIAGLWPSTPAKPHPIDTIDYAGVSFGIQDMGFAYDRVPYGVAASVPEMTLASAETDAPVANFTDGGQSQTSRMAAGARIDPSSLDDQEIDRLLQILRTDDEPLQVRQQSLQLLRQRDGAEWIDTAKAVLGKNVLNQDSLKAELISALAMSAMFTATGRARNAEIMSSIRSALDDQSRTVNIAVIQALAPMGDEPTLDHLAEVLRSPQGKTLTIVDAIQGIRISGRLADYRQSVRPYLNSADAAVRTEAIKTLAGDIESEARIGKLIADPTQPLELRSAGIRTLTGGSSGAVVDATTLV